MRAQPDISATGFHRPAAQWPSASSAGASSMVLCERLSTAALLVSAPASYSISLLTISSGFQNSSLREARVCSKYQILPKSNQLGTKTTKEASTPSIFQQTASAFKGVRSGGPGPHAALGADDESGFSEAEAMVRSPWSDG